MKRYYSHYTFIYPDIYLKNHIVEVDDNNKILGYYPFEKEIEKTEFYSGLIVFIPNEKSKDILLIKKMENLIASKIDFNSDKILIFDYHVINIVQ